MGIKGAILGDIAGSAAEFKSIHEQRNTNVFFTDNSVFTDDTVETICVKIALLQKRSYQDVLLEIGNKYLFIGYGGSFHNFLKDPINSSKDSYGDGAAMRVSFIGTCFDSLELTEREAERSTLCTHNCQEAIRGAKVTAGCIFLAEHGASKEAILDYAFSSYNDEFEYSVQKPLSAYRESYCFEVRCDNVVPVAIRCFYESDDFISFLQKIHYIGGDTDTLGAIGGGIAESYYKTTGLNDDVLFNRYLDDTLLKWLYM